MGPEQKYLGKMHIDESRFREFLYSSDINIKQHAFSALEGMVSELGGLPPFISTNEFREFLYSPDLETKQHAFSALRSLIKELGGLPSFISTNEFREFLYSPNMDIKQYAFAALGSIILELDGLPSFISTKELVDLVVDSTLIVPQKGEIGPLFLQFKVLELMRTYLSSGEDLGRLFACFKTRMKEDVEIHGGEMILRVSECHISEKRGVISKDLFAILDIALISQAVFEPNKLLALDIIEKLVNQGADVRRIKRILKKTADGKESKCSKKAKGIYIEAYSRGFNKPPNWFIRKRDAFRMWKYSKKKTVPPLPLVPVKK